MESLTPVVKNREYEVTIDDLGINGEGIGRIDGFALFVEGALPAERVRVKAIKIGKSFAYAKLLEILSPSPSRVTPPCRYFKHCGGCSLQHLAYSAQLEFKTKMVRDVLIRIGGIKSVHVHQTIGMDSPWRYRNKGQFPAADDKGLTVIGLFAPGSHRIIDIEGCLIQHTVSDSVILIFKDYMKRYGLHAYDEKTRSGVLRHVVSRIAFTTGEVMVIAVTNGNKLPYSEWLVAEIRSRIPGIRSIVQNVNTESTNVVLGAQNKVVGSRKPEFGT